MTRVLVVDDELPVRNYLSARLGMEPDLQVVEAVPDAYKACACLRTHEIDLVLLDYRMEGVDGMQLATSIGLWLGEEVAPDRKRPHVLFCTGEATPAFEAEARAMGARGVVSKGRTHEELIPAIRAVIAGDLWFDHAPISAQSEEAAAPQVLVADTNRASRAALTRALEEHGYVPTLVWSYSDILSVLERQSFQALILDSRLPAGTCREDPLDEIAARWPGLPVLLMGSVPLGMEDYRPIPNVCANLSKPVAEQRMLACLEEALAWGAGRQAEPALA